MIEFLAEYGMFFAKVATFVVAIVLIIGAVVSASQKETEHKSGHFEIKKVNKKFEQMREALNSAILDEHALKAQHKADKKQQKEKSRQQKREAKSEDTSQEKKKNIYVLDFHGDIKASAVEHLREEITAVLAVASADDEIVLRLESPGGVVHGYGLAASQLARIRSAGVPLTICVDKVAASGGYMMACLADRILAAPFAVLGSIGVVASLPNFNKVLKKHDVEYELLTAGEYKRTLTMLGENTEEGRRKFLSDLEDTHELFKSFVAEYRPALDIGEVSTGETWYGTRALDKKLVDEIKTSDEYLSSQVAEHNLFEVAYVHKKNWQEKLGMSVENALERSISKALSQLMSDWNTRH